MNFRKTDIQDVWLIEMDPRADERGYFARLWCEKELREHDLNARIAQVNTAFSPRAGTLRGLHYQRAPHAEVKIARCLRGAVFDVAVDLRPRSPTFRGWVGLTLRAGDGRALYVPEGCAHGYLTLEDETELMYFTSQHYVPDAACGVRYDDPAFGIQWPNEIRVVSEADRAWTAFERNER